MDDAAGERRLRRAGRPGRRRARRGRRCACGLPQRTNGCSKRRESSRPCEPRCDRSAVTTPCASVVDTRSCACSYPRGECFAGSSRRRPTTPPTSPIRPTVRWSARGPSGEPDLAALPIVGITRRRAADPPRGARSPAGSSSSSPGRSARPPPRPAGPRRWSPRTPPASSEIAGLERELERIQHRATSSSRRAATASAARRDRLHARRRRTAAPARCTRFGRGCASARATPASPLERWLTLLFGPGD